MVAIKINHNKVAVSVKLILILLFVPFYAYSSNSIKTISINPLNRVNVYFNALPISYTSILSEDKKTITITIVDVFFNKSDTVLISDGIIDRISIKRSNQSVILSVQLKEKRGFNTVVLPYSNNLFTEVFQWDRLTYAEDKYRTGLLGFEDKIIQSSTFDLMIAAQEKVPNSAAFLGLIYAKSGLLKSAQKALEYAIKNNENIPDIYAALYDISTFFKEYATAERYKNRFIETTKINKIERLINSYDEVNDLMELPKLAFLDSLNGNTPQILSDTSKNHSGDTVLISEENTNSTKHDSSSSSIFEYILFIVFALLVSIVFLYLKWRNKKINQIIDTKKFKNTPVETKVKKTSSKIAAFYKSNEELQKNVEPIITLSEEKKISDDKQYSNQKTLLNMVKKVQDEMKQKQQDDAKIALDKESPKKHENFSAKVELARNIQTEQKKLKDKSLEELKNMIIPTDKNKLNEISKKLGIELGGLETKKTIERIVGNEKELQELTNKFTEKSE